MCSAYMKITISHLTRLAFCCLCVLFYVWFCIFHSTGQNTNKTNHTYCGKTAYLSHFLPRILKCTPIFVFSNLDHIRALECEELLFTILLYLLCTVNSCVVYNCHLILWQDELLQKKEEEMDHYCSQLFSI